MAPSEIKILRYNNKGNKVYALGSKFLRVFDSMDTEFKSIENIEVPSTLTDLVLTSKTIFGIGISATRMLLF